MAEKGGRCWNVHNLKLSRRTLPAKGKKSCKNCSFDLETRKNATRHRTQERSDYTSTLYRVLISLAAGPHTRGALGITTRAFESLDYFNETKFNSKDSLNTSFRDIKYVCETLYLT